MILNLLIGLGNPGDRYLYTRHNVGFQCIEAISAIYNIKLDCNDSISQWGRGIIKGKEVVLAKPQTYMNLSGTSVLALISAFHLTCQDLVVIHDDMDLPLGRLRIREKGGSGGQMGVNSIIESLGTSYFTRLRFGIGRPPGNQEPGDYVLQEFSREEGSLVKKVVEQAVSCLEFILVEGTLSAMNRFNGITII